MIMADVLKIFLLVVGAMLMTVAYALAAYALFPRAVNRWNAALRRRPVLSFVVGFVLSTPLVLIGGKMFGGGAHVPGLLILGIPTFFGLLGSAALSLEIGRGLTNGSEQPWRAVARGSMVLVFALLLPFFGWLILIPIVLAQGIGVQVLAAIHRRRESIA